VKEALKWACDIGAGDVHFAVVFRWQTPVRASYLLDSATSAMSITDNKLQPASRQLFIKMSYAFLR
jgi:hypothetical protein